MSDEDGRFGYLLRETAEKFDEHSKHISEILNSARENFTKDYTGTTGGIGIICLAASLALAFIGKSELTSVASSICGTILIILAVIFRHRSAESQIKYARTMVDLERERARFAQRSAVLQHIWLHGLPEGTPIAQIQLLLGDKPTILGDGQTLHTKAITGAIDRYDAGKKEKTTTENEETDDDCPF